MRFERKYKVGEFSLSLAHQVLRLHPASFYKIYPDRIVNNIYFDTPDLTAYEENVVGSPNRKKYRIRWYGSDTVNVVSPILEVKIKIDHLGAKQLYQLPDFDLDKRDYIKTLIHEQLPMMGALRPVLLNTYHRSYFGTRDGKFRITLDSAMKYFSLLNTTVFTGFQIDDPAIVLELKYDEPLDDEAERIMQYLPFRQTKSSKYVKGMMLST